MALLISKTPLIPSEKLATTNNISKEVLTYLMNSGIQAPSGDNAQP